MDINQAKKDRLMKFLENKDLGFFDKLDEIANSLQIIADKEMPEMNMPEPIQPPDVQKVEITNQKNDLAGAIFALLKGDKPTDEELLNLIKPLITDSIKGDDYVLTEKDKKEIAGKITVPIIEKIIEKTEVIHEQPIVTNEIKEVALTDTGEQIIEKINETEGLIKKERVEGLDDEFKRIDRNFSSIPRGGGGRSKNEMRLLSLTADGITKIFAVPKSVSAYLLTSDFPNVLFENSGFTINASRTQITTTTDNAISSGAQLLYVYTSTFNV